MGRLIDADKLKTDLEKAISKNEDMDCLDFLRVASVIDAQPTAYDPDKVVEQIKCMENSDDITKAVGGLDTFTKNWCMNCEETDTRNEPIFRCEECNFKGELGVCKIKEFVIDKTGDMPVDFGSMGQH